MASASGYMVSALLISTLLKISNLMKNRQYPNPNQAVTAILEDLTKEMLPDQSIDLMYAVFDRKKFELNYVCMGDIIALLLKEDASGIHPFETKMPAITKNFSQVLQVGHLELAAKDRLVFATKGCKLVQGQTHEQYGQARFLQSIINAPQRGVHELRNKIFYDIESYKVSDRPDRDMAVVVAEVKDKVIKLA
jgi:serine phosphatase RsbU (regulator of sigma subunit)